MSRIVYYPDLEAMAREVDWLVVIAPGSAATRGIVSREVLEALGPEGALVNVARGSLVDEAAMVELLGDGRLGGAALDVFADEPRVPEALLRDAERGAVAAPGVGDGEDPGGDGGPGGAEPGGAFRRGSAADAGGLRAVRRNDGDLSTYNALTCL